ncbi:hypothetical protein LCGC14_2201740 [marine sediment metagenome]|uniref:Uncharacterized protein n=1 Tax=marine sediment metagenome TaxID=412755 RepID=A0A0F9E3T9_9ZZZZ
MQLSITDRINLLALMPDRGSLVVLRLLREFTAAVGFTEEEIEGANIKQDGSAYTWDDDGSITKEIEVGPALRDALIKRIETVGEAEEATDAMLSLHDRLKEDQETDK